MLSPHRVRLGHRYCELVYRTGGIELSGSTMSAATWAATELVAGADFLPCRIPNTASAPMIAMLMATRHSPALEPKSAGWSQPDTFPHSLTGTETPDGYQKDAGLVVGDEPLIWFNIATELEDQGVHVLEESDAHEGIAILAKSVCPTGQAIDDEQAASGQGAAKPKPEADRVAKQIAEDSERIQKERHRL